MTPRDRDGPLYLGWEYATPYADPGPPPRRPVPQERPQLSADWLAAQRREEKLINRPQKIIVRGDGRRSRSCSGPASPPGWCAAILAAPTIAILLLAAALAGAAIWQGERLLRGRIEAERQRVERFRADQEGQLFAWQAEHARRVTRVAAAAARLRDARNAGTPCRSRTGSTGWTWPAARCPAGRRC